jgi:hypothetical protein
MSTNVLLLQAVYIKNYNKLRDPRFKSQMAVLGTWMKVLNRVVRRVFKVYQEILMAGRRIVLNDNSVTSYIHCVI